MAKASRASKSLAQQIGERIRLFRKSLGLTQAELAERSSMDDMTISRLETGSRAPSLDQLERLATAFDMPISNLLSNDEDTSLARGRILATMLAGLSKEQQNFVIDFVRLYAEAHGKKPR
jgi:transcriptional regulator with XRE-family HTH domain